MKKKSPLDHVQRLIQKLSAEDRQNLIPYLASLPDSGLASYDLREELEVIQESNKIRDPPPPDAVPDFLFQLVIPTRTITEVHMGGRSVLEVIFRPDNFAEALPVARPKMIVTATTSLRDTMFTDENKAKFRQMRSSAGIQEDDAAFEQAMTEACADTAKMLVNEKAKRVGEGISVHLPRMIGDMFDQAVQGQTFADFNRIAAQLGHPEKQYSGSDLKKMLTKRYWEGVKPHLGIVRRTRTNPAWTPETKKEFAQRVSDRKGLTARIKEVFDDCDGDDAWVQDLKQDSTFQLLSSTVNEDSIKQAIKKVASEGLPPREREPLSVACEIARRELDLPEQDVETLRTYYSEGVRLIKADRKAA